MNSNVPRMSDRYVVERTLGRGGMATVYLARDTLLDRPVVLKVLAEHLAHDESFRLRFQREARLAARLVHPNIVQIYDVGEDERGPFIVMEYVDGDTLADELRRRGRMPADEVVTIGIQLCSALEAAHAARLVHRDIKPQNILRARDGKVKLADFGIARSLAATSHTEAGTVLGTAAYLAPEQARGEEVTAAADIYALGVVLYELLTGQSPFDADTLPELMVQREQGLMTPPRELVPEIPRALEATVMRCLALLPEYRPASAAELAEALRQTSDLRTTAVLPVPARAAPRRRRALAIGAAVALLAAAAALAIVLATSNGSDKAATSSGKTTTTAPTTAPTTVPTTAPTTTAATTTTASTSAPTPPSTPAEALAATQAAIVAAQGSGQLDPSQAADLTNRLDKIARALDKPNANDASHKIDDLRNRLQDLVDGEQLSSAGLAAISAPLDRLAELLPVDDHGNGHGHGKHGGDQGENS
jgi:eukaryotic-like serine/threonine-protein kinase